MPKLTTRQAAFCRAYAERTSGAEAARRAGYIPSSARYQARDLLAKPHVREEIERLRRERVRPDDFSLEGHLRALAAIRDEALAAGAHTVAVRAEVLQWRALEHQPEGRTQPTGEGESAPDDPKVDWGALLVPPPSEKRSEPIEPEIEADKAVPNE